MDIAGVSIALSDYSTKSQVGMAVLSRTIDNTEKLGEGLVKILDASAMEQSVNPGVGANIDIRI